MGLTGSALRNDWTLHDGRRIGMSWKRARNKEQKAQRVEELVNAAKSLLSKTDYHEITFSMIAKEAGFTRSNIYKYFSCKEEVLVELFRKDLHDWRCRLSETLKDDVSINRFSEVWAGHLVDSRRMVFLFTALCFDTRKKKSEGYFAEFNRIINDEFQILSEKINALFPMLSQDKAHDFLRLQTAAVLGIFAMNGSLPVHEQKETPAIPPTVMHDLKTAIEHLLTGFIVSY